jgi:hypothetical protein
VSNASNIEAEDRVGHRVGGLQPHVVHAEGAQRSVSSDGDAECDQLTMASKIPHAGDLTEPTDFNLHTVPY